MDTKYNWSCRVKAKKSKRTGQSIMHLSSIMDLYNEEIIAYTIGSTQDTSFV